MEEGGKLDGGGEGSDGGGEVNMAAWLLAMKTHKIQPFTLPPLGPHDVKVRIKSVGISGSDVHHFKNIRCANFIVKIIEEFGSEVTSLQAGDRVALEPGISCRQCDLCKDSRYNLCPKMKIFGSPPNNGSLANQVVHLANLCFKLPENVSLEEGAMCEPLSVGVHACRRANISLDTKVLIISARPIGLITMLVAHAFGAPKIVIADVDDLRLSFAKELGVDEIIQVSADFKVL